MAPEALVYGRGYACPTCYSRPGEPCYSTAIKPQDGTGRYQDHPFALETLHPKRNALGKAESILRRSGLEPRSLIALADTTDGSSA